MAKRSKVKMFPWEKDQPKAKKKSRGKPVEITPYGESEQFIAHVHKRALDICVRDLPASFRREWEGNARSGPYDDDSTKIEVTLTHRRTQVKVHAHIILGVSLVERNLSGDRVAYGNLLGARCVKALREYRPAEYDHEAETAPRKRKRKPKVATCVLCGPMDAAFPPWEGDCSHTKEERKG